MSHYAIRKNFTALYSDPFQTVRGKLAFKTKETAWLGTDQAVVIPISIYSLIHQEISGDLKMQALISVIRKHVKNQVTVLFAEKAHLQVESLKWADERAALEACIKQASHLQMRYKPYFENCKATYWNSYICEDPFYKEALAKIHCLYQSDSLFQKYLWEDAKKTYTLERSREYPNEPLFIEKSIADILEQCASLLVLANKGYKFYFYPGLPYQATEYLKQSPNLKDLQICWVSVFLSIEKKIVMPLTA